MPRGYRSLQSYVIPRRAVSPKMPVLSPLHTAVGAFCNTFSDPQARAFSFCSKKAFRAHHFDVSGRFPCSSDRQMSTTCYGSSSAVSSKVAQGWNSSFPHPSSVLCINHGAIARKCTGLSADRYGREERFCVSLNEKLHAERRRLMSHLLIASSPTWDTSLETHFSSGFLKGFTSPFKSSSLERVPCFGSFLTISSERFSCLRSSCEDQRSFHTEVVASNPQSQGYETRGGRQSSGNPLDLEEAENAQNGKSYTDMSARIPANGETGFYDENGGEGEITERARASAERRRRSSLGSSRPEPEWRDLLTVPGIGRRNMAKLAAKGIAKLDELKQLYRDKYRTYGTEKMVEFLRSSVGVHKHHATSITDFIKTTVEAEDGGKESGDRSKKRLTFCVEGNISVGKTTFLHRIATETIELRDLVEIVPEPISKWQDVGPDHFNILDAFYGDPERYAYTFQNYVFVTRMMQERESAVGDKRLRLMERSVFSDRMVFVRAVHEAKWMSDAEISIYDSWFDPVVSAMPGLVPDAFIYLRATPDTCHRRLQSRKRKEEDTVTLDYLRGLHEKHEQWLFPAEHGGSSVLSVSNWASGHKAPLSPRLKDRVLYLKGDNVHSSIQKVPALILDCEPSIDFSRDIEAKAEYARQVADFFEYVQSLKDGQPDTPSSLVLPGSSGLIGPDGHILRANSLDGVDLRRHISSVCA